MLGFDVGLMVEIEVLESGLFVLHPAAIDSLGDDEDDEQQNCKGNAVYGRDLLRNRFAMATKKRTRTVSAEADGISIFRSGN